MTDRAQPDERDGVLTAAARLPRVWLAISFVSLAVGFALTFDPSFGDLRSTVVTLVPFLLLPTIAVAFTRVPADGQSISLTIAAIASIAAWTVLVLDDERWVLLTFALYGLAFTLRGIASLISASIITGIWMIAWVMDDAPAWRLTIPIAALVVGIVAWSSFVRTVEENTELTRVIDELRTTRADLAASERDKGVLEERTRVAGEIHDTLAQGFTSIVMLSRSLKRSGIVDPALDDIETVASDNLQSARRLVAAMGPPELDSASLPDAIERHISTTTADPTVVHYEVIGEPRQLGSAADVALIRMLQETLLNVRAHAGASQVHVTLSYLDTCAVLDVVDDGKGFEVGSTTDRGDLTGGQGLWAIRHRVESLGGSFDIESAAGSGTAVSAQIPIGYP